jgi:iron complex outermembrane receptor protein
MVERIPAILGFGLIAGACCSGVVIADEQSNMPVNSVAAGQTRLANASDTTEVGQLEEIIVTATRRSERLEDVPGQVSALDGASLERLRAQSLADFAAFTPGVSFQSTSPSTNLVVIRGITTGASQLNSAIGLYLDDVPIGSSTPFGAGSLASNLGLFDLQRVEVLNGPQGTLFGANALGGTLRYITATPDPSGLSGRVEAEGGDTEHGSANGAARTAINLPFADGRAALRLDGILSHDSGFVDDPDHGRTGLGDADTEQGRASLLFEATPDFTIRVNGYAQRIKSNGLDVSFRNPLTHEPTEGPYDQSYASRQPSQTDLNLGSLSMDWDLHWAKVTSVTAYQDDKIQTVSDLAVAYSALLSPILGPVGNEPYTLPDSFETKRFTQEVRLASFDNQTFEWVIGGFYSHESTFQDIGIDNTADPKGDLLGIPLGDFGLPSTVREVAIFGDGTLHLTEKIDATFGVRESWNRQVFTSEGSGLLVNPADPLGTISSTGRSSESVATYLFNLRYHITEGTMVYARAASGYRPGGPNLVFGGAGTGNSSFQADKLWNYELGLKQAFADGRGYFNLSAYHINWTKIQLTVNTGGINQLVNGGDARVNGAESSFSYRVLPDLTLFASAAYTDAKLTTDSPLLGIDYTGARLPLSPRLTAALGADYNFHVNENISGDVDLAFRHIGARNEGYAGSAIAPLYELAGYNIVDLTSSFRTRNGWEIGPYIKNLFDKRGEVSALTINNVYVPSAAVPVTLTQPRTYGLLIGRSF